MEKIGSTDSNNSLDALQSRKAAELAQAKEDAVEHLAYLILGERLPLPVRNSAGDTIIATGLVVTKKMIEEVVTAYPDIDIEAGLLHRKIIGNLETLHNKLQEIDERYSKTSSD